MNAINILKWVVDNGIDGKSLHFIQVPDERLQTEDWWWDNVGGLPPSPIRSGLYIYFDTTDERIARADMYVMDEETQVELGFAHYLNFYFIEEDDK